MSYEQPGFNPLSTSETRYDILHQTEAPIPFHIVDPAVLTKKVLAEQVMLVDADMPADSFGKRISATYGPGKTSTGDDARVFEGAIELKPGAAGRGRFHHHADKLYHLQSTQAEPLLPHHRFVNAYNGEEYSPVIGCDTLGDRLTIANHMQEPLSFEGDVMPRFYRPGRPSVESGHRWIMEPYAVKNLDIHYEATDQLRHYVHGLMLAAQIGHVIGSYNPSRPLLMDDLVLTPNGPLYRNPDTKEFVHSLERETVTVQADPGKKPGLPEAGRGRPDRRPGHFGPSTSSQEEWEEPRTSFDKLYGIDDIKDQLTGLIACFKYPEIAKRWGARRPSGVLLYGPGGTGKTSIVHGIADAIGAKIRSIDASKVYDMYLGNSERAIRELFDDVRDATEPVVVFFDEFEGVIATTPDNRGAARTDNAVAGIFKAETESIGASNPNVVFAAATNHEDWIDDTLLRSGRFDIHLPVPLPNEEGRAHILTNMILAEESPLEGYKDPDNEIAYNGPDEEVMRRFALDVMDTRVIGELSRATDGMSGADIKALINGALTRKMQIEMAGGTAGPVTQEDLVAEIMRRRRS